MWPFMTAQWSLETYMEFMHQQLSISYVIFSLHCKVSYYITGLPDCAVFQPFLCICTKASLFLSGSRCTLTGMLPRGVHFTHAGWRLGGICLQGLEDGIRRDVGLLRPFFLLSLPILDWFSSPGLVLIVWMVFFVLHPKPLGLLHKWTFLTLIQ